MGAPRLEVALAAYATVIARACELLIFIFYATKKKTAFIFSLLKLFKIKMRLFGKIFMKSAVILYSEVFWALSETLSSALFNRRGGAEVVSGMSAGFSVGNLILICMSGIMGATGVILGTELGKGNLEKCKIYKGRLLSGAVALGGIFMILGFFASLLIPVVFRNLSADALKIAWKLVTVLSIYQPLWGYLNTQFAVSRAGGDTKMGALCDTAGNILLIGAMFSLTFLTNIPPVTRFALTKLSDIPKSFIAHFWLKKEKWPLNLASQA